MPSGGLVTKLCPTLATPWTVAYQAPLSIGFSRQEYWSGLPFPSPGDLPNPGIETRSLALQADSLPTELPGEAHMCLDRLYALLNLRSLFFFYLECVYFSFFINGHCIHPEVSYSKQVFLFVSHRMIYKKENSAFSYETAHFCE